MKHALITVAIVSAIVGGGVVYSGTQPNSWFQQQPATKKIAHISGQTSISKTAYTSNDSATTAYNKVKNAVVTVQNLQNNSSQQSDGFSALFGQSPQEGQQSSETETASEGSGVVYKIADGNAYIVTNNHVVANSDALQVITAGGDKIKATVVSKNVEKDIALIKVQTNVIKSAASFGKINTLQSGQQVLAIGSPLGSDYATSLTSGIISAPRRDLSSQQTGIGAAKVIQTDAAINPGNSGGPLINLAGEVIGINSSKIASSDDGVNVEGIGFAIPADIVQSFIAETEK
ncbi:S1C family serine protease [Leuconostoc sp. MS02]|uniref:S1C family serine protease n=1 Tax=Leuconostoc aquikimchii TaxID=3236804 RepID=A0ABV3S4G5_9LACO